MRVLVVDDEEPTRTILSRWITKFGYHVVTVGSAEDALLVLERQPIDILIVDLIMPVHDGMWLLDRVTAQWPYISVVIESAAMDAEIIRRTRSHGAVDFLPKPFGREQVHQALTRAASKLCT
jgi:CheY-like chemotaxis protein